MATEDVGSCRGTWLLVAVEVICARIHAEYMPAPPWCPDDVDSSGRPRDDDVVNSGGHATEDTSVGASRSAEKDVKNEAD